MNLRNKLGFITAMSSAALFSSLAAVYSVLQEPEMVFPSAFLMWCSYLGAHKITEGTFLDGKEDDVDTELIPGDNKNLSGMIFGVMIHISGIVVAVVGLKNQSILYTLPGAVLFWTGYIIAHYNATDELL